MTTVATFRDVHLSFAGVKAINGVSFEVMSNELFAIIGPNGAGKTSTFNVLSGVYRPQRGEVEFLGQNVLGRKPYDIAAMGLARTFQNIALFEHLTVLDNLMLGRHLHIEYGAPAALAWLGKAKREEIRRYKSPLEIALITSSYGQRFHPVLRRQKAIKNVVASVVASIATHCTPRLLATVAMTMASRESSSDSGVASGPSQVTTGASAGITA